MEAQGIPQRLYHPLDTPTTSLPDLRISGPSSANTGPRGHATKAIYVRTSTPTPATHLSHALVRRTPLSLQTICVKQIREPTANLPPKQSPQPQRVCEHFMAKGTCKFGDNCKFTHVKPVNEDGVAIQIEERPETLLFNLKGMVKSFSRSEQFHTLGRFEEFLDVALKVLDSNEREVQAEAVLVLSNNDSTRMTLAIS